MDIGTARTALVHHWLLRMTGAERVVETMCEALGSPDLYCVIANRERLSPSLRSRVIQPSFLQSFPGVLKHHPLYAGLFPLAVELFDLHEYNLVISSDASTAKGIITRPEACHICYCHSPMRYVWNLFHQDLGRCAPFFRPFAALWAHYVRLWDYSASARVDYFIANSQAVRARIWKYYRRDSHVIHPPCDVSRFRVSESQGDYYLCVGRLVGYKRFDLAVEAFNTNGKHLVIAGEGSESHRLKRLARGRIDFLKWVSDDELTELYSRCKALILPGEEDFGIAPLEAQASGRPVIAYGRGGVLDTVVPGKTGLFFQQQSPEHINAAIKQFEDSSKSFDPNLIREHASKFSKEIFKQQFLSHVEQCLIEHQNRFTR
jgi:glycosyltransferase involved in cell wall biosynthesis